MWDWDWYLCTKAIVIALYSTTPAQPVKEVKEGTVRVPVIRRQRRKAPTLLRTVYILAMAGRWLKDYESL